MLKMLVNIQEKRLHAEDWAADIVKFRKFLHCVTFFTSSLIKFKHRYISILLSETE